MNNSVYKHCVFYTGGSKASVRFYGRMSFNSLLVSRSIFFCKTAWNTCPFLDSYTAKELNLSTLIQSTYFPLNNNPKLSQCNGIFCCGYEYWQFKIAFQKLKMWNMIAISISLVFVSFMCKSILHLINPEYISARHLTFLILWYLYHDLKSQSFETTSRISSVGMVRVFLILFIALLSVTAALKCFFMLERIYNRHKWWRFQTTLHLYYIRVPEILNSHGSIVQDVFLLI